MRILYSSIVLIFSALNLIAQDLPSPQKRTATVNLARSLLTPSAADEAVSSPEHVLKNPFSSLPPPPAPVEAGTPAAAVKAVGDRAQLDAMAKQVNPSGTVQMGGQPILLFGQKKLKVGDRLSIIFEGEPYELQLTAIERTQFTLRFNNEEITRPIKSTSSAAPKP